MDDTFRHIEPNAKDFIKRLLVLDRSKRLGSLKNGVDDVKRHRWFKVSTPAILKETDFHLTSVPHSSCSTWTGTTCCAVASVLPSCPAWRTMEMSRTTTTTPRSTGPGCPGPPRGRGVYSRTSDQGQDDQTIHHKHLLQKLIWLHFIMKLLYPCNFHVPKPNLTLTEEIRRKC